MEEETRCDAVHVNVRSMFWSALSPLPGSGARRTRMRPWQQFGT